MNESFKELADVVIGPEREAGDHERAFELLGFSEPQKAVSLWRKLLPEVGLEPRAAAHAAALVEELSGSPDPDMALLNLSRFADAAIAPSSLLASLFFERPLCHLLVLIFSCSYYLADILIRNPGFLSWLIERETLETSKSYRTYLAELSSQIAPFQQPRRRLNSIKRYQRRECLRIGARDILGLAPLEETTAELAFLADAVIDTVGGMAFERVLKTAGRPAETWDREADRPFHRFAVISLGKLGGTELNYSSDIDLLYVCRSEGADESAFYTALARQITIDLTEPTEEGTLYRVDLRLRPDGESGPLVVPVDEHLNYLLRRARPWEKQALLKARSSAGNTPVADTLLANCTRVVFSSFGAEDPLAEIMTMREKTIAQLPEREREQNIKLMFGGIRDIEFMVQALQLTHGRSRPEVRSRNSLEGLERLRHYGLITPEVCADLCNSYRLFRTTEHRLQLLRNVRTHTIPTEESELRSLGARVSNSALGTVTAEGFRAELSKSIRTVRKLFDALFRDREPGGVPLLLSLPSGEREVEKILAHYGIAEGETAHRFLVSLVYGDFPHLEGSETLQAAVKSLPPILDGLAETPDPSLTLKNLVRIVKATGAVRSMLELLASGGDFRRLLLGLAAHSTSLSTILAGRIELLDGLAEGIPPVEPPREGDIEKLLRSRKRWYEESLLYIHCQHPLPTSGPERLGPLFADVLEQAIRALFEMSGGEGTGAALFALGSLGNRECRFGSDLDLVAVIGDEHDAADAAQSLRRLVEYSRRMGIGPVDLRLRGEGENAPLVQTLDSYRRYFSRRAGFWELLAFSKCRFICGDARSGSAFEAILDEARRRARAGGGIGEELVATRRKLESLAAGVWNVKHAPGGLYDINFVLASGALLTTLPAPGEGTLEDRLAALEPAGLLTAEESTILADAYRLYYLTEHAAALHDIAYPPLAEREGFLDRYLGRLLCGLAPGSGSFPERLAVMRDRVRAVFDRYIDLLCGQ
jgi:glutamate-ammonia-ligase adenylyltransferase